MVTNVVRPPRTSIRTFVPRSRRWKERLRNSVTRSPGAGLPAGLEPPGLAMRTDGHGVTAAVGAHGEVNECALAFLVRVGNQLRVGVLLGSDGHISVQLIDRLDAGHAAERRHDAGVASLSRAIV